MDEIIFDYPEPIVSDGIYSNAPNYDYNFSPTDKSPKIVVINDSKFDGDSLLMLERKPNAAGLFGSGFAKDFYSFKEIGESGTVPETELEGISSASYNATIETSPNSSIRFAVVLIQDNEREAAGLLRRTILDAEKNTIAFVLDSKDDTILAGGGNDTIFSGPGNDIVFGEAGDDLIDAGFGNDYLFGNQGNDRLFGREGSDWLDGGLGNDRLEGGNGDDNYVVDSLGDQIVDIAGTGIETVRASINWQLQAGLDHLFLTGAARTGTGNSLDNLIRGNNLSNTLEGGDGDDMIIGDEPPNKFDDQRFVYYQDFFRTGIWPGSFGFGTIESYQSLIGYFNNGDDDLLKGGNGDDKLFGLGGDDTIYGEAGNDWLFGCFGDDGLFGGTGSDRLDGENGNDWLFGGFGDDLLIVSDGNDLLVGGFGDDKFRFSAKPEEGKTTIQDFTPGQDVIEISKSAFGNPVLSQFSFSPLVGNERNLLFEGELLATVRSSSTFLIISQSVKLI